MYLQQTEGLVEEVLEGTPLLPQGPQHGPQPGLVSRVLVTWGQVPGQGLQQGLVG